jgi:hypothetical protein
MGRTLADESVAPTGGDHTKLMAMNAKMPTQLPIRLPLILPSSLRVDMLKSHHNALLHWTASM